MCESLFYLNQQNGCRLYSATQNIHLIFIVFVALTYLLILCHLCIYYSIFYISFRSNFTHPTCSVHIKMCVYSRLFYTTAFLRRNIEDMKMKKKNGRKKTKRKKNLKNVITCYYANKSISRFLASRYRVVCVGFLCLGKLK